MVIFGLGIARWAWAAATAWAPFHFKPRCTTQSNRDAMTNLSEEERRALNLLAGHSDGCDEAVLLGEGVTVGQLAGLVIDGFATMRATLVPLDGREKSVIWMTISDVGRKAIAE
jgi:hypothetical protein